MEYLVNHSQSKIILTTPDKFGFSYFSGVNCFALYFVNTLYTILPSNRDYYVPIL